MCGIAGYLLGSPQQLSSQNINLLLISIRPRGPDDEGVCLLSRRHKASQHYRTDRTVSAASSRLKHINNPQDTFEHDLALIHTRFSIIDLSEGGHQPFVSQDGRLTAVFNGEIYNYVELREELKAKGVRFRTSSDTEVLVEGYRIWKNQLWNKMNGFWAVAIYDTENDQVIFSRDRVGVAPLYYREVEEGFYFASCLQSLINVDSQGISINKDAAIGFIQTGLKDYDQTTYYENIKIIPSGSIVTFSRGSYRLNQAKIERYWNFPQRRLTKSEFSFTQAVKQFRETLFNAVDIRLRADVKVAFELSGGMDSSSIVAAAAEPKKNQITTYTAKILNADEEPIARAMLKRYKLDFRVIQSVESNFARDCESFNAVMEEPYDNPNAYTHHHMLRFMHQDQVRVVLTGAGGDEVFAGYESSFWPKAYEELKKQNLSSFWQADFYEFCRRFKTFKMAQHTLRHYLVDSLGIFSRMKKNRKQMLVSPTLTKALSCQNQYHRLAFHDQSLYHFNVGLLPFYMRSSDHFTMGVPVEHRFPFLDYRMIELGLQMPVEYLFHNGWTKYVMRKAMEPYLPSEIVWRKKKMGFTFPYHQYLSQHQQRFEPFLALLKNTTWAHEFGGEYAELLKSDPGLLWRMLSTAIWLKAQQQE